MVPMTEPVRSKLIEIQRQRGDTDEQFAALLNVDRSHWTRIRNRERNLTYAITKRAARQFPEIYGLVIQDLAAPAAAEQLRGRAR